MTLWPEVEKVFGHGYEVWPLHLKYLIGVTDTSLPFPRQSISLAASASKTMFASTCKSTSPTHAVVRINSAEDGYRSVGTPLDGHSLTVTRVAFSPPDDKHILSVSRDRSWRLYERQGDATGNKPVPYHIGSDKNTDGLASYHSVDPKYTLVTADKSHARIIWDCAWSAEGDVFATASRDKTVCDTGGLEGAVKSNN